MGIRDDIQTKLGAAFSDKLADAVQPFNGSREVAGAYDPVTGTTSTTTETYSGRGVFARYRQDEVDGQHIISTDKKLIVLQNEVDDSPQISDEINGLRVLDVMQDPAGASWTVQLREA